MSDAGVRSIPLAPFASRQTASFVEHSPSTVIALKLAVDRGPQEVDRLAGLERIVGGDDGEHRRELRVDHPGALCHPADGEAVEGDGCLLCAGVGRQDRLGGVLPACGGERGDRFPQPAKHLLEREQRPDHAGREDEHLLGVEVEQPPGLGGGRQRVELAALAGRRVRDAGVDHDRLRLRERRDAPSRRRPERPAPG